MASDDTSFSDRGISESIGFLLIFTIVIVGIGLVTLYGYPMLLRQQVGADEQIMEKNMIVLQNDIKSLAYKLVPYKETSLKTGSGTLVVYNTLTTPATSTISITDCNGIIHEDSFRSGDLRYESQSAETDISLQNGAVVKRDRLIEGSTMLAEPRWFVDDITNTMVINLIAINSSESLARSGILTAQMDLGVSNYSYIPVGVGEEVCVEYTPDTNPDVDKRADFSTAWNNYFTSRMPMTQVSPIGVTPIKYQVTKPDPNRQFTLVIKKYEVIIKSL